MVASGEPKGQPLHTTLPSLGAFNSVGPRAPTRPASILEFSTVDRKTPTGTILDIVS